MRMYVVRLNPDTRDCLPYSRYPTIAEYRNIHKSSPMDGFHEAVNFLPERGIVRGYLPPKHLKSLVTEDPFVLLTITAKTANIGGDRIVGIQAGCVYQGETKRRGSEPALRLTWQYRCPASLSFLLKDGIPDARSIVLGNARKGWGRGPTFEIKKSDRDRVVKSIVARLPDQVSKNRFKLLATRATQLLPAIELESESTFETDVAKALSANLDNVKGNKHPIQKEVRAFQYERDPKVVASTLKKAKGLCFDCKKVGPFISKKTALPYLEVHHVRMLKDGAQCQVNLSVKA